MSSFWATNMFERGIFDFDSFRWIVGDWLMHLSPAENRLIIINAQKKSKQKEARRNRLERVKSQMSAFHFGSSAVSTKKNGHSCAMSSILLENEIVLFSCKQDLVSGFLCWFSSWCSLCVRAHTYTDTGLHTQTNEKETSFNEKTKKGFSTFCAGFTFSFGSFFVLHYMNLSYFVDLFRRPDSHQAHLSERMGLHTLSGTKGSDH